MTKQFVSEDWIYSPHNLTLSYVKNDKTIVLDPKIGKTLEYLLEHGQDCASRDDIYFELFGYETIRSDNTISSYISRLRKVIEPKSELKNKYIRTIPKRGYQFVGQIEIQQFVTPPPKEKTLVVEQLEAPTAEQNLESPTPTLDQPVLEPAVAAEPSLLKRLIQWKLIQIHFLLFVGLLILSNFFWPESDTHLQASPSTGDSSLPSFSKKQVLVYENGSEQDFDLTPDLKHILYVQVDELGTQLLKLKNMDSGDIQTLYQSSQGELLSPVFSPDQSAVTFIMTTTSNCKLLQLPISMQNSPSDEGPAVDEIASCGKTYFRASVAYLDEHRLLHTSVQDDKGSQFRIRLYDKRFKRSRDLFLPPPQSIGDAHFTISADRQKLAFVRYLSADNAGLYLYAFNTLEISRLIETPSAESEVRWLDEEHLVFVKGEQLHSLNIHSLKQTPISQKVNDLRSPRIIGDAVFARQGPWLSFDIHSVNLSDFSMRPEINSQYSEYMPRPAAENQLYYGATKTGSEQVWLYSNGSHKQISDFQDSFKIIDILVNQDSIWVLNNKEIIKLAITGEELNRFDTPQPFSQLLLIKDNLIIAKTTSTEGSFLTKADLTQVPLKVDTLMAIDAAVYDPTDEKVWFIPANQQRFLTFQPDALGGEPELTLSFPNEFLLGDMWHIFDDVLYFYNKQRAFKMPLNTGKVEKIVAPNFYPSTAHCKKVANFCYLTGVSAGRTEIIRFK